LSAAQSVVTEKIANDAMMTGASGKKIGELIHLARVQEVKARLQCLVPAAPAH
jgi:hypothetical protein